MKGSLDNIQDVVEALDRERCIYALIIGRPEESVTRTWLNLLGNNDRKTKEHLVAVLHEMIEHYDEGSPPNAEGTT